MRLPTTYPFQRSLCAIIFLTNQLVWRGAEKITEGEQANEAALTNEKNVLKALHKFWK